MTSNLVEVIRCRTLRDALGKFAHNAPDQQKALDAILNLCKVEVERQIELVMSQMKCELSAMSSAFKVYLSTFHAHAAFTDVQSGKTNLDPDVMRPIIGADTTKELYCLQPEAVKSLTNLQSWLGEVLALAETMDLPPSVKDHAGAMLEDVDNLKDEGNKLGDKAPTLCSLRLVAGDIMAMQTLMKKLGPGETRLGVSGLALSKVATRKLLLSDALKKKLEMHAGTNIGINKCGAASATKAGDTLAADDAGTSTGVSASAEASATTSTAKAAPKAVPTATPKAVAKVKSAPKAKPKAAAKETAKGKVKGVGNK